MCKLLIMTGITDGRRAEEFMRRMAVPMSRNNQDGLGYTAVNPNGELFAERWHNNYQAFSTEDIMTPAIARELKQWENRLPIGALDTNYAKLGNVDLSDVRSVTMHTRYATCGKGFENTHPFIFEDTSLIHNGTITNAFDTQHRKGLNVNKISTCDSEAALQTYLDKGVNLDSSMTNEWLTLLSGGWAFGILSRNSQGNRILDVVRGSSMLYYMEIPGLGKVFTTDDVDAKSVMKDMNLEFDNAPQLVTYDSMYRFDATTGELLENVTIKPKVYYTPSQTTSEYWGWGNPKDGGRTTSTTSTSRSFGQPSRTRMAQRLYDMVELVKDDPVSLALLPDIFDLNSTIDNLKIDYRKVKWACNDKSEPLIDRLELFDIIYNRSYVAKYEGLPKDLKGFVEETDRLEGAKEVRRLLDSLTEEKNSNQVG
jgi:predicted glutamine amidotransferase